MKKFEVIYLVYAHESGDEPWLAGIYRKKRDALLRLDHLEVNGLRAWMREEDLQ